MFPQLPKPPVLCCWTEQESMEEVRTKHGCTRYVDMDMDIRDMWIQKTDLFCNCGYTRYVDTKDQYLLQLWIRPKCGWYLFGICPQDFLAVAATAQKMD